MVFARKIHFKNINKVTTETTATGFLNLWSNKGATAIHLNIYGISACFINSHLSPHEGKEHKRLVQAAEIFSAQGVYLKRINKVLDNNIIFWLGDFNFRLEDEENLTYYDIIMQINKKNFTEIMKKDELTCMKKGTMFDLFKEDKINFPPTFKLKVDQDSYNKGRRPAWTDRILYIESENKNFKISPIPGRYRSVPKYKISDHRPVVAEFSVLIF